MMLDYSDEIITVYNLISLFLNIERVNCVLSQICKTKYVILKRELYNILLSFYKPVDKSNIRKSSNNLHYNEFRVMWIVKLRITVFSTRR